jgi:hypothetical protein
MNIVAEQIPNVEEMTTWEYDQHFAATCAQLDTLIAESREIERRLSEGQAVRHLWEQGYLTDEQVQRWLADQAIAEEMLRAREMVEAELWGLEAHAA